MYSLVDRPPSNVDITDKFKKVGIVSPGMNTSDYTAFPMITILNVTKDGKDQDLSDHFYTYLAVSTKDDLLAPSPT